MSIARVGDVELYYEEHGSGEPLLCIMGLAADSQAWVLQTPDFAKRHRTIIFDNRGVGRSSKPRGPYSIAQMADEAAGLLDVLDIPRAHVLGVSMGGMIAQELALRHPQRVRGLVLACTFPEPDADVLAQRETGLAAFGGSIGADGTAQVDASGIDPFAFFQMLLPKVFNVSFIETELPRLMELFGGALQYGFDMDAVLAQVEATMNHRTTERLPAVKAPTLVLTGDSDQLIPCANSEVIAKRIPGAKLVKIPGGSHGFNFETPDVFNREVLGFLETVRA